MAFEVGSTYVTQSTMKKWTCVTCTPDYVVLEREEGYTVNPMKTAHVIKLRWQDSSGHFHNTHNVDELGNIHTHNNGTFIRQDQPYDPLQNAEEDDSI